MTKGGLGFDYWVNLAIPEMWLWHLENAPDKEWSVTKVYNQNCCSVNKSIFANHC